MLVKPVVDKKPSEKMKVKKKPSKPMRAAKKFTEPSSDKYSDDAYSEPDEYSFEDNESTK